MKPSKCVLFRRKVEFLWCIVSAQGVEVDPVKIERVVSCSVPQNLTEVKSFLGLCTYYHKFILNFSLVAKPLTMLPEKDVGFTWQEPQEETFEHLKTLLTSTRLALPQRRLPLCAPHRHL